MVYCAAYVNVSVGQIVDLGTVSTTSVPDMLCKAYAVQSDQGVECASSCCNSLYREDICNDTQQWGRQITEPCQCQRHVPCFSMLVTLKFLLMHAEYSVFSNDVCHNLYAYVLHANLVRD